ncbi:origin recognition complex subunit 3 [Anabrus simplex]|uniref:origin recognition complex subunit 3 n=1 Tax=Anabrus simplex TaxID=316456 RepID=UPI0035A2FE0D
MDDTLSLSKGCFVFNNKPGAKPKKSKKAQRTRRILCNDPWYLSFKDTWNTIEKRLKSLQHSTFSEILHNLIQYVNTSYNPEANVQNNNCTVPTAALLTGINMPDHGALFSSLVSDLHKNITPHVAVLQSEKCSTVRSAVAQMAAQFMNAIVSEDEDSDEEAAEKVKKSQCNLPVLSAWYRRQQALLKSPKSSPHKKRRKSENEDGTSLSQKQKLVVVIPEFENFPPAVLQDLILILSGYTSSIPVVLILGVATTVAALHRSLPYHVSARMCIQVFQAPPSVKLLNQVLEQVVFDPRNPFHLGGKTFRFLMDVFLFYDFSVKGFIQGFKFCMMEHFCGQDWKKLCCPVEELNDNISDLDKKDLTQLRNLPSFLKYLEKLEKEEKRKALLKDDDLFKHTVQQQLVKLHKHLQVFYTSLRCLHALTSSLPKNPLGTQMRELYGLAVSAPIVSSSEFRESFQLLGFQSKEELLAKLDTVDHMLNSKTGDQHTVLSNFRSKLSEYRCKIQNLGHETVSSSPRSSPRKLDISANGKMNRYQFKDKLLELSKHQKPLSSFELTRKDLLDYLSEEAFPKLLSPPTAMPMAEILFFDKVSSIRNHIVGAPRAAIHTALNDPQFYLECDCCKLTHEGSLLPSMPDISIAYKLYLECGRFINLYDWLQAFVAVVCPDESEKDQKKVDPHVQARFTRAVAELQFLGFVKASNRKTDHVTKLTYN